MSDFDEKLDDYERHHHNHDDDGDRDSGDDDDYNEVDVQAARLHKTGSGGGLGISLEGTVDVEEGVEVTVIIFSSLPPVENGKHLSRAGC